MEHDEEKRRHRWFVLAGIVAALLLAVLLLSRWQPVWPGRGPAVTPVPPPARPSASPTPAPPVRPAKGPYERVREPAVAGSWYPDDPGELAALVDGYLAAADGSGCTELPLALVTPHAGYRYSGPTAGVALGQVRGCNVRRVWLLGPSHRLSYPGAAVFQSDAFRTPLGDLPVDVAASERLAARPGFRALPSGDRGEHSIEMQLPVLQRALGTFEIVPILMGRIDAQAAREIASAIRPELGPGDVVVVSSDFTHYGPDFDYVPFRDDVPAGLDALDHGAWDHLAKPDVDALGEYLDRTDATICGRAGLMVLAALVPPGTVGKELSYTTSGAITGDWRSSVSYLAGRLDGPAWSGEGPSWGGARFVAPATAEALHALAWRALLNWFETGEALAVDASKLPADAGQTLGAFVTLTREGNLRGCIGEIEPHRPAWQAVAARAVDAAIHDPRFRPVRKEELSELELEVTLLGPSWSVPDAQAIVVGRHGVVMGAWPRSATFLPQVGPEEGWDRATLLSHLASKARLGEREAKAAPLAVYEAQLLRGPRPE